MPTTLAQLESAAQTFIRNSTIPVRDPSYIRPDFWSEPLNVTRVRSVPAAGTWVDFLEIPRKDSFPRIVYSYVFNSYTTGALEFRWIRGNRLVAPDSFSIETNVERHLDRLVTHPYPNSPRRTVIYLKSDERSVVQVRNTGANAQTGYGLVYGWYYPNTRNPNEVTPQEGIDGTVRNF